MRLAVAVERRAVRDGDRRVDNSERRRLLRLLRGRGAGAGRAALWQLEVPRACREAVARTQQARLLRISARHAALRAASARGGQRATTAAAAALPGRLPRRRAELFVVLLDPQPLVHVCAVAPQEFYEGPPEVAVEFGVDERVHEAVQVTCTRTGTRTSSSFLFTS